MYVGLRGLLGRHVLPKLLAILSYDEEIVELLERGDLERQGWDSGACLGTLIAKRASYVLLILMCSRLGEGAGHVGRFRSGVSWSSKWGWRERWGFLGVYNPYPHTPLPEFRDWDNDP